MWSLNGELYTQALADRYKAIKRSTSSWRDPATYWTQDCKKWIGRMAADCSGGVVSAHREFDPKYGDRTANTFYSQCTEKGPIKTIPETPGLCVWRDGHIGIYEGGGYVIEFRGTEYGCVRTKLTERNFTNWGSLRDVDYSEAPAKQEGGNVKMKIMLDPGHYGKNNRSPANGAYYESEAMWKLCGYLKAALEAHGVTVGVTRSNPAVDRPVFERGTAAKGHDLFISLHSNAVANSVNESVDYPVVFVPLNKKGDAIGSKLAAVVEKTMNTKQKGRIATRAGSNNTDYYGVIRGAVSVGVVGILIEHSFHTQTAATNWLLSDANLKRLADAEAAVIAEHYGVSGSTPAPVQPTPPAAFTPYTVKVTADTLNIRKGPGTNYGTNGSIKDKGVYTIVEEATGAGATKWGKLKSGAGWISLDYCQRR